LSLAFATAWAKEFFIPQTLDKCWDITYKGVIQNTAVWLYD
jgi:hypothetical protein